jgi:dephospho-CoA kinase
MPRALPRKLTLALLLALCLVGRAEARPAPRKQVVVLVGLPGAGKTTLARSLASELRAPYLTCGDVVRGWITAQKLPYTPENDKLASQHFARTPGEIARQLSRQIEAGPGRIAIVDGVRSPADLKVLRASFEVKVIALQAPAKLRYQRMLARGRFANEDREYLRARDRREIGLGVLHVLRAPFARVDMRGPLAEVPSQARALARALTGSR